MTCEIVTLPGGGRAIVRYSGRRLPRCEMPGCRRPAERQCDYPIAAGKTCDRYLCRDHAVRQGRNRDFCPDHPGQGDLFAGAPRRAGG
jgi:hypothetical protein